MGLNQIDAALSEALASGPVAASTVKAKLQGLGYTDKMIRAGRARLGVLVKRVGFGITSSSAWSLPALVPLSDAFAPSPDALVPSCRALVPSGDAFAPEPPALVPMAEVEALRQRLHEQIDRETIGEARAVIAAHVARKAHRAEVERLSLALAAARAEAAALRQMIALRDQALKIVAPAEPEPPVEISHLDRVLLGAMPSGWCSVLKITCQRIEGLSSGPTVHRRLGRLAEAGLVESRPGGRQTRHGTAVQVYRRAPAAAVCLMGN